MQNISVTIPYYRAGELKNIFMNIVHKKSSIYKEQITEFITNYKHEIDDVSQCMGIAESNGFCVPLPHSNLPEWLLHFLLECFGEAQNQIVV